MNDSLKIRINAGWRHFVDLPEIVFFDDFYDHTEELEDAEITGFDLDGVVEMQLEFEFREHKFFVSNQFGDYWFLVEDPNCPDEILLEIIEHYRQLLEQ